MSSARGRTRRKLRLFSVMAFMVLISVPASAADAGAAKEALSGSHLLPVAGLAAVFRDDHGKADAEEGGQQTDDGEAASEHVSFPLMLETASHCPAEPSLRGPFM
jgi:hypothetical protein